MVERIEHLGLKPHVIVGTEHTVIAVIGDDRQTYKDALLVGHGVADVLPFWRRTK